MSLPHPLPAPPLSGEMTDAIALLAERQDTAGLWWLSGYAAGLAKGIAPAPAAQAATPRGDAAIATRPTIVYGSQTGNARRVAEALAADLAEVGLPARLLRADAYPVRELKDERHLYLVVSTQGDGDPPDDARGFCEFLASRRAPRLEQLAYAVLGLGDSSYPKFCAIGHELDARLAELGAKRLLERGDADLDIEGVAVPWRTQAVATAKDALKPLASVTPLRPSPPAAAAHGRERPFPGELLRNQRLTAGASDRDIRHLEIALEGSGLAYEPGDALGVWARNPDALVDAVLAAQALDGDTPVAHRDEERPLRDWLAGHRELTRLGRPFVAAHAERAGDEALQALLASDKAAALVGWMDGRQVIDLLLQSPAAWDAQALVAALRPMTPRLYSIASSRKAVGEEAHLCVAHVAYDRDGARRHGAASHFLSTAAEGVRLPVYVEANERFRLPADGSRDLVMIGAGTGVAPFRGFVQERQALGAGGRHWLFFGNPRFRSDFVYQLEWQRALKEGALQRIDLAFSRDQAARIHVPQRLRERGRELFAWLQEGAHLYVCGSIALGRDVHAALLDVVAGQGGLAADAAADYLERLQSEGRYRRDVY